MIKSKKKGAYMATGGARVGAGRPKTNKPTTKATIYKADRKIINDYALSLGIPVNELMHRVFTHKDFESYITKIQDDFREWIL